MRFTLRFHFADARFVGTVVCYTVYPVYDTLFGYVDCGLRLPVYDSDLRLRCLRALHTVDLFNV